MKIEIPSGIPVMELADFLRESKIEFDLNYDGSLVLVIPDESEKMLTEWMETKKKL